MIFVIKEYGLPCDTRFGCNFSYAELLLANELYGAPLSWRTFMCPLEGYISKLLAGRQLQYPKLRSFYTSLFKKTRQTHGGYYGQEREKVIARTAHRHRGTDCVHAQHWPNNCISACQAGGVQDCRIGNAICVSKKSFDEWRKSLKL